MKKSSKKFNITKLEVLATSLKKLDDGKYKIQVGIFGNKDLRKDSKGKGPTNAEIGYVHEMGSVSRHIPRRSFLLDTFTNHQAELNAGLKPLADALFKEGKVDLFLDKAGQAAVLLVQTAFFTSGWGSWAPNAYSTLMAKLKGSLLRRKQQAAEVMFEGATHAMPLISTGQLWQSIAARAVKS